MKAFLIFLFAWTAFATDEGRSRFDHLFPQEIPFPFEKLLKEMKQQSEVKAVILPLGRSLQRKAGAPEVFRYPRVVAASGDDQIFIGYNEKARILEVISYNETLGQFQFQVVHDYDAKLKPRVRYAQRRACISCHQNEAPLFSVAPWDETQANPLVADKLKQVLGRFYQSVPTQTSQDAPFDIDSATDRANMFAVYQQAWSQLCETPRCRAQVLSKVLEMRLSGKPQIEMPAGNFARAWQNAWPKGLMIPNPDIPNRNPMLGHASIERLLEVDAEFEPLNMREPLDIWDYSSENVVRLFSGLAFFLKKADLFPLKGYSEQQITAAVGKMSPASLHPPFSRPRLLRELYRHLGKSYFEPEIKFAEKAMDEAPEFLKEIQQHSQIKVFRRCAGCHNNEIGFPPNFLYGEVEDVKERLAHCAERIFYRLSMWNLPQDLRHKSPMPPVMSLEMSEENWRQSNELKLIETYIKKQLTTEGADLNSLVKKRFEQLRSCL